MAGGGVGGIEVLLRDYANLSRHENIFCILWGVNQPIAKEIGNNGHEVIELNASHSDLMKSVKDVIEICRDRKIEVVVAHHSAPLSHVILMVAKWKNPTITTIAYAHSNIHEWPLYGSFHNLMRRVVFKRSFQKADRVIAISGSVRDSVRDIFRVPEEKINVVYNGVDVRRFSRKERAVPKQPYKPAQIIYVGRLIEGKGVQVIIKALACIDREEYHFQIVGDGPYRYELERLTEQYGLSENVDFLGTRQDVPDLLQTADVFIHVPVLEEGFGITVVEAMASGRICICSKSGGIPELIENNGNGFLVEKNDSKELAATISYVIKNLNTRELEEMRQQARKKANKFDIHVYSQIMDELLDHSLNPSNRGHANT
jgi:glycosyltransferase involved in cell wall biosynthesis